MATSSEERQQEQPEKESFHKTKTIQFLGRTTPIILQNDNGPCPLLAICNVLLLKNNLSLSPEVAEVSQEKLLSLVAERLIDSNSNVNNKSDEYVENQQQNIADAIDLLPRLATGIDVNIKFRRIDDFEFTPECAIFDLLDIPLYHGWIVDPQDHDTASAIGSKSYNALMEELVALETRNVESKHKNDPQDDDVDFAAATAATLGVPSPCLSRGRSFDESPHSVPDEQKLRKGDMEEEAELLRALKLSEHHSSPDDFNSLDVTKRTVPVNSSESETVHASSSEVADSREFKFPDSENLTGENQNCHQPEPSIPDDCNASSSDYKNMTALDTTPEIVSSSLETDKESHTNKLLFINSEEQSPCTEVAEKTTDKLVLNDSLKCQPFGDLIDMDTISTQNEGAPPINPGGDPAAFVGNNLNTSEGDTEFQDRSTSTSDVQNPMDNQSGPDTTEVSSLRSPVADSDKSSGRTHNVPDAFTPNVDGGEPMYEGEECILDSGKTVYEDREPMYEGEVVLAKQSDKGTIVASDASSKDELTPEKGQMIGNFLKNSASQLSIYGLFCLQDGLKERELCVFFRNNHFNTMFKFDGELYILATDQGYINQPDLVWEKLNEVNGNSVFMTSNFKEFTVESQGTSTWDEQNAMVNTADYLASIDNSGQVGSNFNSDFQLALALQQQEFEQQPQRHNVQQPTATTGSSRLVTGPQVHRSSVRPTPPSSRQEAKKDKCIVM